VSGGDAALRGPESGSRSSPPFYLPSLHLPPKIFVASIYGTNLMPKTRKTFNGPAKNRTAEEARRLSISEDTLLELWNRGIIPGIKIGHRAILFDPFEVDATLEKHFGRRSKKGAHA